jgi:uncharacterized membrane protein (DUF485 family)
MSIIDYIDQSHLLEHINKVPSGLITEIAVIIFGINFIFALIYCSIYRNNKNSFKNIHNLDEKIKFFDFVYYSHTLFFSLGYDLVPQSGMAKIISMIHLKMGFIITVIYISKIISSFS